MNFCHFSNNFYVDFATFSILSRLKIGELRGKITFINEESTLKVECWNAL